MPCSARSRIALFAVTSLLAGACGSSGYVPAGEPADTTATGAHDPDAGATPGDSSSSDAAVDAAPDATAPTSRCQVTDASVFCEHNVTQLVAGTIARDVYWQIPTTPPPPGGYPVVIVYQGSFGGPKLTWATLTPASPFGGFHQGRLHALLLDHGFTVIAPEAAGGTAWQTNSGLPYASTTDKPVIDALIAAIGDGTYGPANEARLYATGISSGGYMTSRMAVSYPGVFRALAIHSASYATCAGLVCNVPSTLPADHPPTLMLHGKVDTTVPLFTAERYYDALVAAGHETTKIVDPDAGHEWLAVSPEKITDWFSSH